MRTKLANSKKKLISVIKVFRQTKFELTTTVKILRFIKLDKTIQRHTFAKNNLKKIKVLKEGFSSSLYIINVSDPRIF